MDERTKQVLRLIQSHSKIKNYLTSLCYIAIISGLFVYVFYAIGKNNHTVKLVKQYNQDPEHYKIEKIMTNPSMNFQYEDGQVYHIKAKKAHHMDQEQVVLYDVFATGDIGNITAGELEVNEQGDHLIFTQNPVLILNRTQGFKSKSDKNEQ